MAVSTECRLPPTSFNVYVSKNFLSFSRYLGVGFGKVPSFFAPDLSLAMMNCLGRLLLYFYFDP